MIQKLLINFIKKMLQDHGTDILQDVLDYLLALLESKETGSVAAVPSGLPQEVVEACADFVNEL